MSDYNKDVYAPVAFAVTYRLLGQASFGQWCEEAVEAPAPVDGSKWYIVDVKAVRLDVGILLVASWQRF